MEAKDKANVITIVIEYALKHPSFTIDEMVKDLGLNTHYEDTYVRKVLVASSFEPNTNNILGLSEPHYGFGGMDSQGLIIDPTQSRYSLLPSAYFAYADLQEVKIARENAELALENSKQAQEHAQSANNQSRKAIKISMWALIVSLVIGLLQILIDFFEWNLKNLIN